MWQFYCFLYLIFFKKNKIQKTDATFISLNIFHSLKFFPLAESHPPATIKTQPPSTGDHAAQPPATSDLVFTQKFIPPSPSSLSSFPTPPIADHADLTSIFPLSPSQARLFP
jgi:hypothetical protein